MSITDELRKWAEDNTLRDRELTTCPPQHVVRGVLETLLRIADRIDAEHERLMRERKGCIHYDQERHYCNVHDLTTEDYKRGYDDGFASADDWLAQHEDAMAEHGWVKGPLDADGEMWHSGDMSDSNWGVIESIAYEDGGWFVRGHDTSAPWIPADSIRHHHAPTVEDVLREMVAAYMDTPLDDSNDGEFFAQYAAKLRLAGDAE